jgi:hypothetical protein
MAYLSKPFICHTDASGGFTADLSQKMDGCHQPVVYVYKIWSSQEKEVFLNL